MVLKRLGRAFNEGAYKRCHTIVGDNKNVAVISLLQNDDKKLKTDFKLLKRLERLKIPVVKAELKHVMYRKRKRLAIVMPRYDENIRIDGIYKFGYDSWYDVYITPAHLSKLKTIYKAIKRNKVYMFDMQFLIKNNPDDIVLSDPGDVETKVNKNNLNLAEIKRVISRLENEKHYLCD